MLRFAAFLVESDAAPDLGFAELTYAGHHFATGVPVTFPFVRNIVSSKTTKAHKTAYQQDIEPAGRYMSFDDAPPGAARDSRWVVGKQHFANPLVIAFNTRGGMYDEHSWKYRLFVAFKAKGRALSNKLKKFGYDGIITLDKKYPSEIIVI